MPPTDPTASSAGEPDPTFRGGPDTRPWAGGTGEIIGPPEVPGYEIVGELGRGGMGVVYEAVHRAAGRRVALKMIHPDQPLDRNAVARFQAEVGAVVGLDHPNVVPVYDVGEAGGRPFFAMKLVTGGTLRSRGAELRADPRGAVRVLAAVARAVHYAHQRGIIHRDLKPANVLLDEAGTPFVTDFGLAKRTDTDDGLTATGAIMGTPSYMAPEQAGGKRDAITTLTDVYALGAVLYELLTGRPPFQADTTVRTLVEVVERDPPPPESIDPAADPDLAVVALKCLSKAPADRYASAGELADELQRWLDGEPIRARPPGLWRVVRSVARRHGAAVLKLLVVGVVGGALVGGHLYLTDVQQPLRWNAGAFDELPSADPPWLARLPELPGWLEAVFGPASVLWAAAAGLLAVLAVRPQGVAGDLAAGMAAGVVTGVTALCTGAGWALVYGTSLSGFLEGTEARAVGEVGLSAKGAVAGPTRTLRDERGNPLKIDLPPGWQEDAYPELRGRPPAEQAALLNRKLRAELSVGVQFGIWYVLASVGVLGTLATVEAAIAGALLRRYGRVRPMLVAYAERVLPAVGGLFSSVYLGVNLLTGRSTFRPETWGSIFVLSVALGLALVFRLPRSVRWPVLAALAVAIVAVLSGAWSTHDPDVVTGPG